MQLAPEALGAPVGQGPLDPAEVLVGQAALVERAVLAVLAGLAVGVPSSAMAQVAPKTSASQEQALLAQLVSRDKCDVSNSRARKP